MKKSISWTFITIQVCLFIAWFSKDQSHRFIWFLIGIILGLIFEVVRLAIKKYNTKKSNSWTGLLFIIIASLGILSGIQPAMLGIAAGLLLPLNLVLIVIQLSFRKVISWNDIDKENK